MGNLCVLQYCIQAFVVYRSGLGLSAEAVSFAMPLNEKSLMELFVVYLLISFNDFLSVCQCARQGPLCVYADLVMAH